MVIREKNIFPKLPYISSGKHVVYIGSAIPIESSEGLEAVQQPLRECFLIEKKDAKAIDSILTVLPNGLQLQYTGDQVMTFWFPISCLTFCAAVRCINVIDEQTGSKSVKFVSLNSPLAQSQSAMKPVIFAAIIRRTVGRKILECHSFICRSAKDAIDLVKTSKLSRDSNEKNWIYHSLPFFSAARVNSHGGHGVNTDTRLVYDRSRYPHTEPRYTLVREITKTRTNDSFHPHRLVMPHHKRNVPEMLRKDPLKSMHKDRHDIQSVTKPTKHYRRRHENRDPYVFQPQIPIYIESPYTSHDYLTSSVDTDINKPVETADNTSDSSSDDSNNEEQGQTFAIVNGETFPKGRISRREKFKKKSRLRAEERRMQSYTNTIDSRDIPIYYSHPIPNNWVYTIYPSRSLSAPESYRTIIPPKVPKKMYKKRISLGAKSKLDTSDSIGYVSEIPKSTLEKAYPIKYRDVSWVGNQFGNEKAFSKRLVGEQRFANYHQVPTAYMLNQHAFNRSYSSSNKEKTL